MTAVDPCGSRNVLLRALAADDYGLLERHMERVELSDGQVLAPIGKPIEAVWFPESGVTACGESLNDGSRVGIAIAGYEGMACWPILLGSQASPHEVAVHIGGGEGVRIEAEPFLAFCRERPAAQLHFLRYVQAVIVQMQRTAVSNLRDPVDRRLARWILMAHDRLEGDELALTHKHIAEMLGVRRASVTDGIHSLEGAGLVRSRRGRLLVRDREGLKAVAGESYGIPEAFYSRTIAAFGK